LLLIWDSNPLVSTIGSALNRLAPFLSNSGADVLGWLLSIPLQLAAVALVYRLWFVLLGWKPLALVFEYTTLTRLWGRYREPQTKLTEFTHLQG
jgi:hypothetical protein